MTTIASIHNVLAERRMAYVEALTRYKEQLRASLFGDLRHTHFTAHSDQELRAWLKGKKLSDVNESPLRWCEMIEELPNSRQFLETFDGYIGHRAGYTLILTPLYESIGDNSILCDIGFDVHYDDGEEPGEQWQSKHFAT